MIGSYPNIEFSVVKLAQQMANPLNKQYWAGLHLCRYLLNSCKYQIVYDGFSNESVVAYSNSDWAQDPESYKSMTSYFTLLAYGVISWISYQQKIVALSSTEAEYIALSDCSHQLVWMRNLLNEAGFNVQTPHIYSDNLGSLFWKPNSIQEKCSKHIDIYSYYIRDLIEDEQIELYCIDGKENPADILTKNLGQVLFSCFCPSLSLEIL